MLEEEGQTELDNTHGFVVNDVRTQRMETELEQLDNFYQT